MNDDKLKLTPFDASEYLDNEELIAEYLNTALRNPDQNAFFEAALDVMKARGVAKTADKAGVGRESLYKSFKTGSKLRFETVVKVLQALDLNLNIMSQKPLQP